MTESTPAIVKGTAVTPSEELLAKLGERTFLSLWSYPAVHRDQGIAENGHGKEVCDLLVVFGDDIIIFSDKCCAFPSTGTVSVDWGRWFRAAVQEGAKQLWGAERWIRQHPDRLFLDRACQQPFPVPVPSRETARYHLVAIANGSADRTQREFGGRGGLVLELSVKGAAHYAKPYTVGDLDPTRTFVHVFDDVALPLILSTLDTVADFVRYLERRAAFCRSSVELLARSEQDLLALYLRNETRPGQHEFVPTEGASYVVVDQGFWDDYEQSPERHARMEWARVSYLWDSIIEDFAYHTLTGTHEFAVPSFSESNQVLKLLAREPRSRRRLLATAFRDALHFSKTNERRIRYLVPQKAGEPHYVFLFFPKPEHATREQYRERRLKILGACCAVTRLEYPDALDIVGLAMESGVEPGDRSVDAAYLDGRMWTEDDAANAHLLQLHFRIHENPIASPVRIDEPRLEPLTVPPITVLPESMAFAAQLYCGCGSGLSYAACHGSHP
jgi:hypothetical protein